MHKKNCGKRIMLVIAAVISMTIVAGIAMGQQDAPGEPIPGILTTSGDNPLTTSFTWIGNGNATIDVVAFGGGNNPSGNFIITGIPAGATIVKAFMYAQEWGYVSGASASANLNGVALASVYPISNDSGGGLNLANYRWDVTSIVTGNGNYSFTTSSIDQNYMTALAVVYSSPSLPSRQIIINDGAESLGVGTSTTIFNGVQKAGAGTLFLVTDADNVGGTENVSYNNVVVAGPGDIFNGNQGIAASLLAIPVNSVAGLNSAKVSTDGDWFGWDIAILITEAQSYQYCVRISPFIDVMKLNVNNQGVISGVDVTSSYIAPVLGTTIGDKLEIAIDLPQGGFELAFIDGRISTKSGTLWRTFTGNELVGPTPVSFIPASCATSTEASMGKTIATIDPSS